MQNNLGATLTVNESAKTSTHTPSQRILRKEEQESIKTADAVLRDLSVGKELCIESKSPTKWEDSITGIEDPAEQRWILRKFGIIRKIDTISEYLTEGQKRILRELKSFYIPLAIQVMEENSRYGATSMQQYGILDILSIKDLDAIAMARLEKVQNALDAHAQQSSELQKMLHETRLDWKKHNLHN